MINWRLQVGSATNHAVIKAMSIQDRAGYVLYGGDLECAAQRLFEAVLSSTGRVSFEPLDIAILLDNNLLAGLKEG
jgi:hypothetical protein